jgi:hypothetical protein
MIIVYHSYVHACDGRAVEIMAKIWHAESGGSLDSDLHERIV